MSGLFLFRGHTGKSPEKNLVWLEPPANSPPKKLPEKESLKERQIVQTSEGKKVQVPNTDAFLGKQNQVVEKETVSKKKIVVAERDQKKSQSHKMTESNSMRQERPNSSKGRINDESPDSKRLPSMLSRLGVLMVPSAQSKSDSNQNRDQPEWATPGMRPQDYVSGIAESDKTSLNTKEYKFYGYFQRIRERLDRAWVPILRKRLLTYHRTGRQIASERDHLTRVLVTLNEKGEVIRAQILAESGTQDLDNAAVEAFNQAGPFPNPPKGIVDSNHEIIVPWNFVVKT